MSPAARRSDAERNRGRILEAARALLADRSGDASMAEVARRADVGMATLYRNFPGRRELLEALYAEEVDGLVAAAAAPAGSAGAALQAWLRRFVVFHADKHPIAVELLRFTEREDPVFESSRERVLDAGRPLLAAAQEAGEARIDVALDDLLDLVLAVVALPGDRDRIETILRVALDGVRA